MKGKDKVRLWRLWLKCPLICMGLSVVTILLLFATCFGQTVPTSQRSKEAMSRVCPKLIREFAGKGMAVGSPIFIRVFKEEKELEVWVKGRQGFRLFKAYPICTYGPGVLGPKVKQGDAQAPEGFYTVKSQQLNPRSAFHLSFNIGYPNEFDRSHKRTGGSIMVHGDCVSIGCYAIGDQAIEEVYALAEKALESGQPCFNVHIFPFRMTDKNMEKRVNSEWYPFWQNLKEGYDSFEDNHSRVPIVKVKRGRYVFVKF